MNRAADERAWWKSAGIDPIKVARKLWDETLVNEARIMARKLSSANFGLLQQYRH
jgi:hypothetical protein